MSRHALDTIAGEWSPGGIHHDTRVMLERFTATHTGTQHALENATISPDPLDPGMSARQKMHERLHAIRHQAWWALDCGGCGAQLTDDENELCETCRRDPGLDGTDER